jgi:hypothetical protein
MTLPMMKNLDVRATSKSRQDGLVITWHDRSPAPRMIPAGQQISAAGHHSPRIVVARW